MKLVDFLRRALTANGLNDERLYAHVADEVAGGFVRKGLWAKAVVEADGDETKAKARYLRLRVESLKQQAPALLAVLRRVSELEAQIASAAEDEDEIGRLAHQFESQVAQEVQRQEGLRASLRPLLEFKKKVTRLRAGAFVGGALLLPAILVSSFPGPDLDVLLVIGATGGGFGGLAIVQLWLHISPNRRSRIRTLSQLETQIARSELYRQDLVRRAWNARQRSEAAARRKRDLLSALREAEQYLERISD